MVLEAGTGRDVLLALAAGASQVTAVEENSLLNELIQNEFADYTFGLYNDPRVTVMGQSGRVFARARSRQIEGSGYDVGIISLTDPHRPVTSGAYSLTENYLYTVEAFGDYLGALDEDGLLMVNRWQQTPPSESGRIFGTAVAALEDRGLDPAQHLVAFRTLRTMTILAGLRPFTPQEIETTRDFLAGRGFDVVYFPGIQPEDANRTNLLPEPVYYDLFQQILADSAVTYDQYQFDIRPPADDRPFFFHYFKWRQTPEILATFGLTWQPFGGSGYFVLVALLLLLGLATAVLIIGPLLIRRRGGGRQPAVKVPGWRPKVLVYLRLPGIGLSICGGTPLPSALSWC